MHAKTYVHMSVFAESFILCPVHVVLGERSYWLFLLQGTWTSTYSTLGVRRGRWRLRGLLLRRPTTWPADPLRRSRSYLSMNRATSCRWVIALVFSNVLGWMPNLWEEIHQEINFMVKIIHDRLSMLLSINFPWVYKQICLCLKTGNEIKSDIAS